LPGNRHPEPLFRYAIVSDTHIRPPGESSSPWRTNLLTNDRARWVAEQVNSHRPDLVIHLGDVVHPVPHLPTYGSASKVAQEIMSRIKAPLYYVPGNHDVGDKDNPTVPSYVVTESYQEKFLEFYGPLYRSFDHRGVHFVLINSPILGSGLPHEAEQREWLEADLEEHRGSRIHAFSHYPPYIHTPHEPSNYDNVDEPARTWLLGLLEEHGVEAFFAGHVHHYGYRRYRETGIHGMLSTCFVRQDYAEMFRVEPADEYGRNDAAKLGYCTVEVYAEGHAATIHRSHGLTLGPDETHESVEPQPAWGPTVPLGVHLRHPLAETVTLPYNGPIDEFVRKKAWNDYTLLGLLETGFETLRLPLSDLLDPVTRGRLYDIDELGYRYGFFTVDMPNDVAKETMSAHRELVDFLEVIVPWETASTKVPQASRLRDELSIPVYVANIESSIHRERKGPKYSHYVSHGFRIRNTASLDAILPERGAVDGFVFQVGQHDDPWPSIRMIDDYAARMGTGALVNVRLAPEDPAEYLCDEDHVANRVAESLVAALASPNVKVFLDTFMDLDRGYFPRIGLYDRRLNPRKGSHVARRLAGALNTCSPDLELGATRQRSGWRICGFNSPGHRYELLLPQRNTTREDLRSVLEEPSGEIIDLETGRTTSITDEHAHVRDTQYLHIYPIGSPTA
jgi:3',5'-cyclic AMP phosphodiesterase CpdA